MQDPLIVDILFQGDIAGPEQGLAQRALGLGLAGDIRFQLPDDGVSLIQPRVEHGVTLLQFDALTVQNGQPAPAAAQRDQQHQRQGYP
ncbi:hypothetical protein [Erwinia persicina]|uniref:hypothetical protein n=1 Tax=Erwinia persicina TaxID=55211 RepID=UPI001BB33FBC|nr:hypothetical protein [Erwinia persicina]